MNKRKARQIAYSWASSLLDADCDDSRFLTAAGYTAQEAAQIAREIEDIAKRLGYFGRLAPEDPIRQRPTSTRE